MRKHVFALVIALSFAAAAQADLTFYGPADRASFTADTIISIVETFDSVTPKDTALASFVSQGVTYTGLAGSPSPNVWVTGHEYGNFSVFVPAGASVLTANGDEDFTVSMTFAAPVTAVGFDTYLNPYGPATIQVLNSDGWTSTTLSHDPTVVGFFGVTSGTPISTIRWTTVKGGTTNTGIDNVQIGVVPVPGAVLLGLLGLGAAGIRLRRSV